MSYQDFLCKFCFNPSFCGFGIGGKRPKGCFSNTYMVSILVSVDSVLEGF